VEVKGITTFLSTDAEMPKLRVFDVRAAAPHDHYTATVAGLRRVRVSLNDDIA
jgi:hypothetical protein